MLYYLCPSFRPSKIFFVAFFSATIDGRNLIFGHKLHIGMPYCGKRFWTRQIPTSFEHICGGIISEHQLTVHLVSTAGTFSHVYVCTQHINKDQYRSYTLNYFDFTLLSSTKMMITKIDSMTENYPEFPVTNLNYAGGHAGHQIIILVAKNEIWSPRRPFQQTKLSPGLVGFTTAYEICAYHEFESHEVYLIQHCVIKFVSDLWQISGFLRVLLFPPPKKLTATIRGFKVGRYPVLLPA